MSHQQDKAVECNPNKKKKDLYYVHTVIGLAIIVIFWLLPPIEPITPIGMRCVGAFLGMVYLWSMCGTLWPSIVGCLHLAFLVMAVKEALTEYG